MTDAHRFKVIIQENGAERYVYVDKDSFVIGRGGTADVIVPSDLISRQQLQVSFEEGKIWVEDLGSSNGTWINEDKLALREKTHLQVSDNLALGSKAGPFFKITYLAEDKTRVVQLPQREKKKEIIQEPIPVKKVVNGPSVLPEVKRAPQTVQPQAQPRPKVVVTPQVQVQVAPIQIQSQAQPITQRPQVVEPVYPVPQPVVQAPVAAPILHSQTEAQVQPQVQPSIRPPTEKERLTLLDPIQAKVSEKKADAEKGIFEQIKNLMNIEAEEIRLKGLEEARKIQEKAEAEGQDLLRQAKEEAARKVKEAENTAALKLAEVAEFNARKLAEVEALSVEKLNEVEAINAQRISEVEAQNAKKISDVEALNAKKISEVEALNAKKISDVEALTAKKISEVESINAQKLREVEAYSTKKLSEVEEYSTKKLNEVETYSTQKLTEVESISTKKLADVENLVTQKMNALQQSETEITTKVQSLHGIHLEFSGKVEELKKSEHHYRTTVEQLQKEITTEEARIKVESAKLAEAQKTYDEAKRELDLQFKDLALEERKIRARIEVDTLEAKAKMSQIVAATEQAQNLKDTLAPEVQSLKLQKDRLDAEVNEMQAERKKLDYDLDRIKKDFDSASYGLEQAKKVHDTINKGIEIERKKLTDFQEQLAKRETEIRDLSENSRREAEATVNDSINKGKIIIEEARTNADQLVRKGQDELRKVVEQQEKLKNEFERVKAEALRRIQTAQEDYNQVIEKAKVEADKITYNAEKEALKITDAAKIASEDAKAKSDAMLNQLKEQIVNRSKESAQIMSDVENKKKTVEAEIRNLEKEREKRLALTNEKTKTMLETADREISEKRRNFETGFKNDVEKAKAQVDAMLEANRIQALELKTKLENEAKDSRQKQLATLAELRQIEMFNIKKMREKAEEEIFNKKSEKAKSVATNVYAMVTNEMLKVRNKALDETMIEGFTKGLKEMIVDTMLDKANADSNKLQEILKTSEDAKAKERRFWKKVGVIGGSTSFVILLLIAFPSIITGPKKLIVGAFSEDPNKGKANEAFTKKIEETRKKHIFNPETTPSYKVSYVDNVLYTTEFVDKRNAQAFQDKWILELNDYFINQLDVKDTTLIKFVSLESAFVKDLAKMKKQVDPDNMEPKFEEMRAREVEFREKLSVIFEDQDKVSKFYEFAEKFWNDFYNPRKPASN